MNKSLLAVILLALALIAGGAPVANAQAQAPKPEGCHPLLRRLHMCQKPEGCHPLLRRLHMCQKPAEVLSRFLSILPEDDGLVVDPFGGAASTAVVADQSGRESLVVEKCPKILDLALQRLEAEGFTIQPA